MLSYVAMPVVQRSADAILMEAREVITDQLPSNLSCNAPHPFAMSPPHIGIFFACSKEEKGMSVCQWKRAPKHLFC
jgi:hypothetical protein